MHIFVVVADFRYTAMMGCCIEENLVLNVCFIVLERIFAYVQQMMDYNGTVIYESFYHGHASILLSPQGWINTFYLTMNTFKN